MLSLPADTQVSLCTAPVVADYRIHRATSSVTPPPRALRRDQAPRMVLEYGYVRPTLRRA